jgi:hypothetical protein
VSPQKPAKRKSLTGVVKLEPKPKLTRQGDGQRSKPNHGRKKSRGQGK